MIIAASFTALAYSNQILKAQAAEPASSAQAPESGVWRSGCVISNIMVGGDRIHVRCTTALADGTQFYAIHADSAHQIKANRILSILTTAFEMSRPVDILYETDVASNPPGCNAADCRFIKSILIAP